MSTLLTQATLPLDAQTQAALARIRLEALRYVESDLRGTLVSDEPYEAFRAEELELAYLEMPRGLPALRPPPMPRVVTARTVVRRRPSLASQALILIGTAGIGTAIGALLDLCTR